MAMTVAARCALALSLFASQLPRAQAFVVSGHSTRGAVGQRARLRRAPLRRRCSLHQAGAYSVRPSFLSMELDVDSDGALDRRSLVGAAWSTLAAGSAAAVGLSRAEPALAALGIAPFGRRPASKRKPGFLCDDAVAYLQNPSKQSEVWIVGTAHISDASARLVESVIRKVKPQVVMVELDAQRIGGFLQEEAKERAAAGNTVVEEDKPRVARNRTPSFGSFMKNLLEPDVTISDRVTEFFAAALGKAISKMYESMDQEGFKPGQEFTVAIREARNCGAKLLLGDRDVKVTLRRLSQALRATNLEELSSASRTELGLGLEALEVGDAESISTNLENLKNRATMSKVTNFYRTRAPELYSAMIAERDKIMAVNLMTLEEKKTTVAVVGLAHVDGIEQILSLNGWKVQRC